MTDTWVMDLFALALLFLIALSIFVYDFRDREIPVISLVLLLLFAIVSGVQNQPSVNAFALNLALNALFVLVQILCIAIYVGVRYGQPLRLFQHYLGVGDILFWIAVLPLFSFSQYVFVFVSSLAFAMALHLILRRFKGYLKKSVPLAGMQSLYFFIAFAIEY